MKFRVTLRDQRSDATGPDIDLGIFEEDDANGQYSEDELVDYLHEKLSLLFDRVKEDE